MLLEAKRESLYEDMPVPDRWHEAYAEGEVNTDYYWNLAKKLCKHLRINDYYSDYTCSPTLDEDTVGGFGPGIFK